MYHPYNLNSQPGGIFRTGCTCAITGDLSNQIVQKVSQTGIRLGEMLRPLHNWSQLQWRNGNRNGLDFQDPGSNPGWSTFRTI